MTMGTPLPPYRSMAPEYHPTWGVRAKLSRRKRCASIPPKHCRRLKPHWNVQVFISSSSGLSLEGFVAAMLPPSSEAPGAGGPPLEPLRHRGSASTRHSSSAGDGTRVNHRSITSGAAVGAPCATAGRNNKKSSLIRRESDIVASRTSSGRSRGGGRRNNKTTSKSKKRRKQSALLGVRRVVRSDASRHAATRARTTSSEQQESATLAVGNERHHSQGSMGKPRRGRGAGGRGSSRDGDEQAFTGRVGGEASFLSEMEKVGVVTDLVELFQQVHNALLSV